MVLIYGAHLFDSRIQIETTHPLGGSAYALRATARLFRLRAKALQLGLNNNNVRINCAVAQRKRMNKLQIRKIFKEKRSALKASEINTKSQLITNNFITNLLPKIPDFADKKLAFYLSANNEVDTKYLIEYSSSNHQIIALPKISDNKKLIFKQYKIGDELEKNILFPGIFEPKSSNKNIIPDIVFVPLIAFDKNCNRIGMGKGFYDITISELRFNIKNIIFIGLGYDFQLCEKIPYDELDQSLDFIVSESEIFFRHQEPHNANPVYL